MRANAKSMDANPMKNKFGVSRFPLCHSWEGGDDKE